MIPVIWHHGVQWLGCTGMLNEILSAPGYEHFCTMRQAPRDGHFVVMVIHGDHERNKAAEILDDLKGFQSSLCIVIGESGEFPSHLLQAPHRKIWEQCWKPNKNDFTKKIILGYPPDAPSLLSPYNTLSVNRGYDWFFAGQITHSHRRACVEQLRSMKNGHLLETPGFWQGMPRPQYYEMLTRSKIVPCPSGPETPDTFRIWEAIEAGCFPIVDASCPKHENSGFWGELQGLGLTYISMWESLPSRIEFELAQWPHNRDSLYMNWLQFKQDMRNEVHLACQMLSL